MLRRKAIQGFKGKDRYKRISINLLFSARLYRRYISILQFGEVFRNPHNSFTYPDAGIGCKIEGSRLILSKIGSIRIFKHREIEGKVKTCTLKRDGTGCWYAILTTEREDPVKLDPETAIGVDLGISHAAVTSEGLVFDYPKYYVQAEKKNRAAEKTLHRRKKDSQNRKKAQIALSKIGKRIANLRDEFCHQVSRKLVDSGMWSYSKISISPEWSRIIV